MSVPFGLLNFSGGEIAPALFGHIDLERYHTALSTCRNMFVGFRGGVYSRPGTKFVGQSKQRADLGEPPPHLIPFRFSIKQQYELEFGDFYMRIIANGGFVTETALNITGATQAAPAVLTVPGHTYVNGDWVAISGVLGMTQLNSNTYVVGNSNTVAGTFSLFDPQGVAVNSTVFNAYIGGGTAARIYEIMTPFAAVDVPNIKFIQSADVMSLTHPNYPPQELKRFGPTNWTITPATFAASITAPPAVIANATVHGDSTNKPTAYAYAVTAIDPASGEESIASPIANVTNSVDMAATAGSIKVEWDPVPGVQLYNVYRSAPSYNTGDNTNAKPVPTGSLLGLITQSFGGEYVDTNSTVDFTQTPPEHIDPFSPGAITAVVVTDSNADWTACAVSITSATGSGFIGAAVIVESKVVSVIVQNGGTGYLLTDTPVFTGDGSGITSYLKVGPASGTYPSLVAYFQQRRVYAATLNNPDTYWMSQPGAFLNFDSSVPTIESDAITGTPWSEQVNGIQWMLQMPVGLVTFTAQGVWTVTAGSGNSLINPTAITPSNQLGIAQSSVGASPNVEPIKLDWNILYLEAHNNSVRELTYQIYFNIFTAQDISWPSSHLLTDYQIDDWAWCREPYRVLWAKRNDGTLLSLTYVREQQVSGWARHTTQGLVEGVSAITELPDDVLYLVTRRFPNNAPRFFIERMDTRHWKSVEDTWAVDCGLATVPTFPNASLFASAASGAGVTFTASSGVFSVASVGQVIRMGGGIAVVTAESSATQVTGTWLYPCQELIPDDPDGTVMIQFAGNWSIAPQITSLGGLLHLAGHNVVGLADGIPIGPLPVSATGFVSLPFGASQVVLGLGFVAQMQTLPLEAGQPTMAGRRKRITAATVLVENSAPAQVGVNQQDASLLSPQPTTVNWSSGMAAWPAAGVQLAPTYNNASGHAVQPLYSWEARVPVSGAYDKHGQVAIQQRQPLPLAVLMVVPEVQPGDLPEGTLSDRQQGRGPAAAQNGQPQGGQQLPPVPRMAA